MGVAVTDSQGEFRLWDLPAGKPARLHLTAPAHVTLAEDDVAVAIAPGADRYQPSQPPLHQAVAAGAAAALLEGQ